MNIRPTEEVFPALQIACPFRENDINSHAILLVLRCSCDGYCHTQRVYKDKLLHV